MTKKALDAFDRARDAQLEKNEARRIRTKVNDAQGSPYDAAARWPFELLQNALDAGPRGGRESVQIIFREEPSALVFEHDGALFELADLAALLSGGSNKGFDDVETTGRFGTGFLVTHVLATRVQLTALIDAAGQTEQVNLRLDRSGDEDAIVGNMKECRSEIERAVPLPFLDNAPSARFVYEHEDADSMREGLRMFHEALPYLFSTCRLLGSARLERGGATETWEGGALSSRSVGDVVVHEREIRVVERGLEYRVVRIDSSAGTGAIVALERANGSWRVIVPASQFPRVFCRYPIRTSSFLPINFVLDAPFDLDQERRAILLAKPEVKELFHHALTAVVPLVELAWAEDWELRHRLARIEPTPDAFGDKDAHLEWMNDELRALAERLATMSIVDTPHGVGPAISGGVGWYADFIRPRLSQKSSSDDTTIQRMWSLVADTENFYPPTRDLAEDWSAIASGWSSLGIEVNLVALENLAAAVRDEAVGLDDLNVRCDRRDWLARFIDCVGECWSSRGGGDKAFLDGLLPDQHARLASGSDLHRGKDIPEELKDIAEAVGVDVRRLLVDEELLRQLARPDYLYGAAALRDVVNRELTDEDVIRRCIEHLRATMPEGKVVADSRASVVGSVGLLDFLWRTRGEAGSEWAKDIPLMTRDGKVVHVAPTQRVLAPVSSWHAGAMPFSAVYPESRVLADEYCGNGAEIPRVIDALLAWGVTYAQPLVTQSIGGADVKRERLRHLLADESIDVEGLALGQTEFSQIALLHEVLPRCGESPDLAASLLGLVLTYVAPNDPNWQTTRTVAAHRSNERLDVEIRPALWLADILSRPWIPVGSEEARHVVVPDPTAVSTILRPECVHEERSSDPSAQPVLRSRRIGTASGRCDRRTPSRADQKRSR